MKLIDKIKEIHKFSEIKGNTLFLRNKIKGSDVERIIKIWDGSLYTECITGAVNLPSNVKTIIGNNTGKLTGDLTNVTVKGITSSKKLKKNRRRIYKKA